MKTINEIVNLYSQGLSCYQIGRRVNKSPTYIYNYLNKNKVRFRTKSQANKIFPDFLLVNLYNIGLSTSQIGELLGIHSTTITKRFKKIHFPLRNKSVAKLTRYSNEEFAIFFNNNNIKLIIEKVLNGIP